MSNTTLPKENNVVIKKTKEGYRYCEVMYVEGQTVRTLNFKGFMNLIMNEVYKFPVGEQDKAMEEIYIKMSYIIDYLDPKWFSKHKLDPDFDPFSKENQERNRSFLVKKANRNECVNVKNRREEKKRQRKNRKI